MKRVGKNVYRFHNLHTIIIMPDYELNMLLVGWVGHFSYFKSKATCLS